MNPNGSTNALIGRYDGRSGRELLTDIRTVVTGREALLIDEWSAITAWADQNVVETLEGAATLVDGVIDTGTPIAGPGAPLVSEFNLMELIATLGRSPDGGRVYVGRIIECAWRLPGIYAGVLAGRVPPWKAERIADLTRTLSPEAAAFVDRQLCGIGDVTWAQIDRLVTEAIIRFDPEKAEADRKDATEHRHCDISATNEHGLAVVSAVVDAADGHDLNHAVAREAEIRGRLGDDSSLDVRRSKALGSIARRDLSLDLLVADEDTGEVIATSPGRKVELTVHITDTSLTEDLNNHDEGEGESQHRGEGSRDGRCATSSTNGDATSSTNGDTTSSTTDDPGVFGNPVGRWEEGNCPISIGQIKEWLRTRETTQIIVRPVIDLADCVPVDSYEIPERHRRRVHLRDHTCRFPNCPKKAARCDLDHQTPHAEGGATCPCNLVPLCRRHHRAKTFSLWRYVTIQPGHYLWLSPHGRHLLVGPDGTRVLDPPRPVDPDQ